jgi:hypothetical protein
LSAIPSGAAGESGILFFQAAGPFDSTASKAKIDGSGDTSNVTETASAVEARGYLSNIAPHLAGE